MTQTTIIQILSRFCPTDWHNGGPMAVCNRSHVKNIFINAHHVLVLVLHFWGAYQLNLCFPGSFTGECSPIFHHSGNVHVFNLCWPVPYGMGKWNNHILMAHAEANPHPDISPLSDRLSLAGQSLYTPLWTSLVSNGITVVPEVI